MASKKNNVSAKKLRFPARRFKLAALLMVLPMLSAALTFYYIFSNTLAAHLGNRGNDRLVTQNWQMAQDELMSSQPQYGPKFAYYKLQPGQNLDWASSHFSVSVEKLQKLNPGHIVAGTTILIPPVEQPLVTSTASSNSAGLVVKATQGVIYVSNSFYNPKASITIPQLMILLKPYGVIERTGPKTYMISKPLYIVNNIRLDITDTTVDKLELKSAPDFNIVTLTFRDSEALIRNTNITSIDPTTGQPDSDIKDGRSFVRAYDSGRMDVINSHVSYLGTDLEEIKNPTLKSRVPFLAQGGVYGVSWRISTGSFGQNIVTGWVQNSTFDHNHIGSFTFGASGMMWRNNLFTENNLYGLDPHDDSNNATIEYNRFIKNGKHGFIVSKRCNYNVIRFNTSIENKLHGFMLHENSNYNLIENNISIGNADNYVIYASNFNTIRNNKGYNPRSSHVRINAGSTQNFIQSNLFYSGNKGVYLYDRTNGVAVIGNMFYRVGNLLATNNASRVVYSGNQSERIGYEVPTSNRVVFGKNTINKNPAIDLKPIKDLAKPQNNLRSLILSDL